MKQVIWKFEKEEDYKEFLNEFKQIPKENGYVENEDENSIEVVIIDLKK